MMKENELWEELIHDLTNIFNDCEPMLDEWKDRVRDRINVFIPKLANTTKEK